MQLIIIIIFIIVYFYLLINIIFEKFIYNIKLPLFNYLTNQINYIYTYIKRKSN